MIKILGIDNLFFEVGELASASEFYRQIGFNEKFQIPQIKAVLFSIGDEEPGLIISESLTPSKVRLWVEVEDAKKIREKLSEVDIHGNLLETATGFTFEVNDPWGNIIGFADYLKKPELKRKTNS
jgi:catechol-2,3-dioxygenase